MVSVEEEWGWGGRAEPSTREAYESNLVPLKGNRIRGRATILHTHLMRRGFAFSSVS